MLGSQNIASQTDVAAIRAVTDLLPDAGALTALAVIQAVTDLLPNAGALFDLAIIRVVTDVLPDAGVLTSISDETDKIDQAATDGLTGTADSLASRVQELERHFHNVERWWGALAGPTETNAIEANVSRPFVAVSGNNEWGTVIPILGTDDNPVLETDTKYDCHRVAVTDLDNDTTPWRLRIIWGSGTSAAAISADQWTEVPVMTNAVPGNRAGGTPVDVIMRRQDVGMKLWAQSWNDTLNEELDFFWGAHGYVA